MPFLRDGKSLRQQRSVPIGAGILESENMLGNAATQHQGSRTTLLTVAKLISGTGNQIKPSTTLIAGVRM